MLTRLDVIVPCLVALVVGFTALRLARPTVVGEPIDRNLVLAAADRAWPSDSARIPLFVFSDYQCHYCRDLEQNFSAIAADIRSHVSVAIRHAPFISPTSLSAAIAMECAAEAGSGEKAHKWLFQHQNIVAEHPWDRMIGAVARSDSSQVASCIANARTQSIVREDVIAARKLGIRGTPTIIFAGKTYVGALTTLQLETIIRQVLDDSKR